MSKLIQNIPTHLFLGFLGVGKTSAILSCFKQKPAEEHWAVLVNEFGKQGIDGKIYHAKGIAVKEVPGGCLCCAVGVPFQVAVTQILQQQRPDRLFIESSGASHAEGVLKTLQQESLTQVLDLKAKICLLDPNHLLDERYANNINYKAQLAVADVIIANKIDRASTEALTQFHQLTESFNPTKSLVQQTRFGEIELAWLNAPVMPYQQSSAVFFSAPKQPLNFKTQGWSFSSTDIFNLKQLVLWMQKINFIRAKAIINTAEGWHSLNSVGGSTHIENLPKQPQARIEIIMDNNVITSKIDSDETLKHCLIQS